MKRSPQHEVMGVTRAWRYSKEKMRGLIEAGRIVQSAPGLVPAYQRYLDEMPGLALQDVWTELKPAGRGERLGDPTQRPVAMVSDPGDRVLDSLLRLRDDGGGGAPARPAPGGHRPLVVRLPPAPRRAAEAARGLGLHPGGADGHARTDAV